MFLVSRRITYVDERKYLQIRCLLTPVTTKVTVKRALPPIAKKATDFDIHANINQFKVGILRCLWYLIYISYHCCIARMIMTNSRTLTNFVGVVPLC